MCSPPAPLARRCEGEQGAAMASANDAVIQARSTRSPIHARPAQRLAARYTRQRLPRPPSTASPPQDLAAWNTKYEEKFGHVFLICATGRAAAEILSELRARFPVSGRRAHARRRSLGFPAPTAAQSVRE